MSINTLFTQIHTSRWNCRLSLCVQELFHPQDFSEFLQPLRDVGTQRVRSIVVSFLFGFGFWVGLGNSRSPRSIFNILDTGTGWDSIPLRSSLSRVSMSHNTVVVEVDELEDDVG